MRVQPCVKPGSYFLQMQILTWIWRHNSVYAAIFARELGTTQLLGIICCEFVTSTKVSHSYSQDVWTGLNGPFPWNMLIAFTHAYRPCWLANAIELCTKQTRNRVFVTNPLAVYKTARCYLILPTKTLVRTHYVQFTYFMGRVYSLLFCSAASCAWAAPWSLAPDLERIFDYWWRMNLLTRTRLPETGY